MQFLENFLLRVSFDRLENRWFQFLPGQRLIRAGSWLTHARLLLICADHSLTRAGTLLFEGVANLLKRLFAPSICQAILIILICDSSVLKFSRIGIELPISNKVFHENDHVGKQFFEFFSRVIIPDRFNNHLLQICPV